MGTSDGDRDGIDGQQDPAGAEVHAGLGLPPGTDETRNCGETAGYNRMLWTALKRKAAYLPG